MIHGGIIKANGYDHCAGIGSNDGRTGGAIYNSDILTITGGTISKCNADRDGGGIYNIGRLNFRGGTITECNSYYYSDSLENCGGGICNSYPGTVTFEEGTVTGCNAPVGGGIHNNAGTLNIKGGSITNNTTDKYGGGIHVFSGKTEISGGRIENNKAIAGGGICMNNAAVTLSGGSVRYNDAGSIGGGIEVFESCVGLCIEGKPEVSGNTARGAANNIELEYDQVIYVQGKLDERAVLGVSMLAKIYDMQSVTPMGGVFTSGLSGNGSISNFFSDNDAYVVGLQEEGNAAGEAVLEDAHMVIPADGAIMKGVTGSFNDRIKLNFYFDIPAALCSDEASCVILTNENAGKTINLLVKDAEFVTDKGYKFSIPLAAKEAGDMISREGVRRTGQCGQNNGRSQRQ